MQNEYLALQKGEIVYLKHMHFPDCNKIDFRTNGRPYLILNDAEEGQSVCILKVSTAKGYNIPDKYYFKVEPDVFNRLKKTSYVDLRYIMISDAKDIVDLVNRAKSDLPKNRKKSDKIGIVNEEEIEQILQRFDDINGRLVKLNVAS